MIFVRRVVGGSMLPGLQPGQIIIARHRRNYRRGQVVIARSRQRTVVKRIADISTDKIKLSGDNSTASNSYSVAPESIIAAVIWPRL